MTLFDHFAGIAGLVGGELWLVGGCWVVVGFELGWLLDADGHWGISGHTVDIMMG